MLKSSQLKLRLAQPCLPGEKMSVYFHGFFLGLALSSSLGPQNIFLIRQGLLRNHPLLSAFICYLCEILLITLSIFSIHKVLENHPLLIFWLSLSGITFLSIYGIKNIRQSRRVKSEQDTAQKLSFSRLEIIFLALSFSLLNPLAIIDSMLIIGSQSHYFTEDLKSFILGLLSASFLWFSFLLTSSYSFSYFLKNEGLWRRFEFCSGVFMLGLGIKMGLGLF